MNLRSRAVEAAARVVAWVPSESFTVDVVHRLFTTKPNLVLEGIGPELNRSPRLGSMPIDLEPDGELEFHHLSGLFASTALNHGIVAMTIRQLAYVYGLARRHRGGTAIEIGRWRGGSTIALAAGLGRGGKVWSIDLGEKEQRMFVGSSFDAETRAFCDRFGLAVELLVGDSRTIEVDADDVDLVLIDGDHDFDAVLQDFERFGRRARVGGSVLFDDAYPETFFGAHPESVGRAVEAILANGDFELTAKVDRLAHLTRVR